MEQTDYRPLAAILAVAIAGAWARYETRARSRPPGPVGQWGAGRVGPAPPGYLTRLDWLLAIGSVLALVGIIVVSVVKAISG